MGDFDPFAENLVMPNAVSDFACLTHLLKSAIGTGILSMPYAFMYTGLILGIIASVGCAVIVTHCCYILIQCAHRIYYAERRSKMTYAEVTETSFTRGPEWAQKLAVAMKLIVLFSLFLSYFGICCVYIIVITKNLQQVFDHWAGQNINDGVIIAGLFVPVLLLTWIPNLKILAPFSMLANVIIGIILLITCYYSLRDVSSNVERNLFRFSLLPSFCAITIFSIEGIGAIMPLENNMRTPTHFVGMYGVLNQGMLGVTILVTIIGFLGYLRFGEETAETITLNFPINEWTAQSVNLLIAFALFFTFGIQFAIVLDTAWNAIKRFVLNGSTLGNYILRTFLVILAFAIAALVPSIVAFIELIGAFCFSIIGLIMPVLIESIMEFELEPRFGKYYWVLWKNIFIFCFGIFALILGSKNAIAKICMIFDD